MIREIIEEIKNGFGIAVEELLIFFPKILCCLYIIALPVSLFSIIPVVIGLFMRLLDVNVKVVSLVFNILLSVFLIPSLSLSMAMVFHEKEKEIQNQPGISFTPSKDFVIALYVIICLRIWGVI